MPDACWSMVTGSALYQGDYLPGIQVPLFQSPFVPEPEVGAEAEGRAEVQVRDVIVVSQTCDLANGKLRFVALCSVNRIAELEELDRGWAKRWKDVAKGRHEGLHLLGSCGNPDEYRTALVVDFREIISLPLGYVQRHAYDCGSRWRLKSPYLEHLSQAFGRFYMRVALPDFIDLP